MIIMKLAENIELRGVRHEWQIARLTYSEDEMMRADMKPFLHFQFLPDVIQYAANPGMNNRELQSLPNWANVAALDITLREAADSLVAMLANTSFSAPLWARDGRNMELLGWNLRADTMQFICQCTKTPQQHNTIYYRRPDQLIRNLFEYRVRLQEDRCFEESMASIERLRISGADFLDRMSALYPPDQPAQQRS